LIALVCLGPIYRDGPGLRRGRDVEPLRPCSALRPTPWRTWARGGEVRSGPEGLPVVPMVGAIFIDFTNALIITLFLNIWK
jgi:hypothetical protein